MQQTGLEDLLAGATDYERLSHFDGEVTLEYSHSLHAYTTVEDGVRRLVPGVTSVCAMIDKSGPLTQWAANETVNWVINKFPSVNSDGGDRDNSAVLRELYECVKNRVPWHDPNALALPEQWLSIPAGKLAALLNEARFNYRSISKDATDIGHLAHEWLEGYIKALIAENTSDFDALSAAGREHVAKTPMPEDGKAYNCVQAALRWFERHKFRPLFSEKKIYSRRHGYAGTIDWLAWVTSCGDPNCCPFEGEALVLGDFKSSRSLYDEYFCQLAAYREAIEEEFPDLKIGACVLLRLGKEDGEFESRTATVEEFESDLDGFLGILQTYHWQKQRDLNRKFERELAKAEEKAKKELDKATAKADKEAAKAAAKAEKEALKEAEKVAKAALKAAQPKTPRKRVTKRAMVPAGMSVGSIPIDSGAAPLQQSTSVEIPIEEAA